MSPSRLGKHPPLPRIALRVGVTGHRPHRLPDPAAVAPGVRRVLDSLVETLQDLPAELLQISSAEKPVLRVLSGMAEGADRLVAHEALAVGAASAALDIEVQAILPFARDEYTRDFESADSRAEYDELLARSRAVLELDGSHEGAGSAERSYEYLGEMLLRSCDMLVAVWDGGPSQGRGGAVFILERALVLGMPVACLDVRDGTLRLSTPSGGWQEFSPGAMREAVLQLLLPPAGAANPGGGAYFQETEPGRRLLRRAWPVFRVLGTGAGGPAAPAPPVRSPQGTIASHYEWANELAVAYAERFRGTFLVISLAAALAVLFSVFGSAVEHETRGAIASLVTISLAIGIWVWGTRGRWHERWIDYRLMAELLRDLDALLPIAAGPPAARHPAHAASGDPGTTWVAWHVRRVQREAGLPGAAFGAAYLREAREGLRTGWLGAQIAYHDANAHFHKRLDRRLGVFGFGSFVFTLVALAWFIVTDRDDLRLLEAGLPALAAWFATIRGHAELERVGRRSAAMADGLAHLQRELLAIPLAGEVVASRELVLSAESIANTMVTELLDWRIMFGSRRLELPG